MELQKGRYSVFEVEDYISMHLNRSEKLEVVNVNSTEFNNGTSRDYQFWSNINHPETGELLKATKGYMGVDSYGQDRCYYAEYQDANGKSYCYVYQFPIYNDAGEVLCQKKSIEQQQREDIEERIGNLRKIEERKSFSNFMKTSQGGSFIQECSTENVETNNKNGQELKR